MNEAKGRPTLAQHAMTNETEQYCAAIHPLLPAFSINATDPDETVLVQKHLAACPQATSELASYLTLAEALLFSAPPVMTPAGLEGRIRAGVRTPPSASSRAMPQPLPMRVGFWQRLRQILSSPQFRPALVLGVLAVVALLAVGLYFDAQVRQLRGSQASLIAQLTQQQAVLTQVGEGAFLRISLPAGPAGEATAAYATVVCNPKEQAGFVLAENLPALAADQAYQIWLIRGEERISGGLFRPDAQGNGAIVFRAPKAMGEYEAIGISAEPIAGSPGPTSLPVIQGSLYGDTGYQS